jgi:nucleotide-binding universal stress UspA family protein
MKILIATDGSKHSKKMLTEFAGRTFAPNTKVRIISAYDRSLYMMNTDPIMGPLSEYNAIADNYSLQSAKNAVEEAAAIVHKKRPKLSISTAAIEGPPKSVILEAAKKYRADLIVVGSHGHGAVAGFLLGSVSQAVSLHAPCSVEIVR